mmetsp:Transcript_8970/g.8324  ORF Transcript_8970/g.8324 Transcript_8970/m.8324 type:complete len:106 (+) Transcript_8970:204-521(+)
MKKGMYGSVEGMSQVAHQRLSIESLGQIKLKISTYTNIHGIMDSSHMLQTFKQKFSPMKETPYTIKESFNPFSRDAIEQSFANEQPHRLDESISQSPFHLLSETH